MILTLDDFGGACVGAAHVPFVGRFDATVTTPPFPSSETVTHVVAPMTVTVDLGVGTGLCEITVALDGCALAAVVQLGESTGVVSNGVVPLTLEGGTYVGIGHFPSTGGLDMVIRWPLASKEMVMQPVGTVTQTVGLAVLMLAGAEMIMDVLAGERGDVK